MYWLILFGSTSLVVVLQRKFFSVQNKNQEAEQLTRVRKLFHLLVVLVYGLGIKYDKRLLFLCSYGLFILFILLETIRYYKIGVLYKFIQENLMIFLDEKDKNSSIVFSHTFLLFGLSYPIWISDFNSNFKHYFQSHLFKHILKKKSCFY
jgi:hypothetical protein